jgi:molybdopterin converting factor small subunit
VEVLDQQIAAPGAILEKLLDVLTRLRVDPTAFRGRAGALERLFRLRHVFILSARCNIGDVGQFCNTLSDFSTWDRPSTLEDVMHVELLGLPRERAGVAELELEADTLGQLLAALAARFPSFSELIAVDRLQPSLAANLNGDRFISDPGTRLRQSDSVLILSADAGG